MGTGQANALVLNQINKISKNAQAAIKVANSIIGAVFGGSSARGPIAIAGITGTVNRLPVNTAVVGVIGNKKIFFSKESRFLTSIWPILPTKWAQTGPLGGSRAQNLGF